MNDLSNVLNIPIERHKAEVRRAINDELLNTIAAAITGNAANETEWAKEGRRIIPLLKRATPFTAFTSIADEGADHLALLNQNLTSPIHTKSDKSRSRNLSPGYAIKYSTRTPPKDLAEMVTKVKDENTDDVHCVVRTPPIAMAPPPSVVKQHTSYLGGEVVVLPSGKAVRLHMDKLNEINEAIDNIKAHKGGSRKRKMTENSPDIHSRKSAPAFEILSKNALMNMMPPPPSPVHGPMPMPMNKIGLLGQQLMTPPRGGSRGSRRGSGPGSRGGRRPKSIPRLMAPPPAPPMPVVSSPPSGGSSISNLALLAEAVNHQQEQDAAAEAATNSQPPSTASNTTSEPPQIAITPPKVVVVTTPSGTVLRTTTTTSTTSSMTEATTTATPSTPHIVASTTPATSNSSPTATPSSTATMTPKTVKLKVGDSPMKVYPMGARILPKSAITSGSTTVSGSPVFMVATSQNLMRVARSTTAQTVTLASGQRVVTVNTANLRPTTKINPVLGPTIKTLQPRVVTSITGAGGKTGLPASNSSKPSVIVVQRTTGGGAQVATAKTILTKVRCATISNDASRNLSISRIHFRLLDKKSFRPSQHL